MTVPPGILFCAQRLPRVAFPPVVAYAFCRLSSASIDIDLPTWGYLFASILSLPLSLALFVWYTELKNTRAAAAHGAIMLPKIPGAGFGNMSLLRAMVDNFKSGNLGEIFLEWTAIYGNTYHLYALFESRIITSEPEYIKRILATSFDTFEKGPLFVYQFSTLLGSGVFNSDGEMWKFHRSMTKPFFTKDRITHFDIFERHADDAMKLLKRRFQEGHAIDIQDAAHRFLLDSASESLFGEDVHSLAAGLPYPHYAPSALSVDALSHPANVFARAFGACQSLTALRSQYGQTWPLAEFWSESLTEPIKTVRAFIDPIVTAAVARRKSKDVGKGGRVPAGVSVDENMDREVAEGETLLDHLVNYTYDERVLRDEILNITVAARDTANTITFCVYMLAEHPDILRRLRAEIFDKVGANRPTYEDLKDMKLLRAVINETLRLWPPVPFNVRFTNKATVWPGLNGGPPIYIPANTRVGYHPFVMHRRKDLWGPDALVFDPDRFLDDRLNRYLTPNPFIFLPFNAGARICLGQQFAYNEMSFFMVRLLQNFSSIALAPEAQPLTSLPPVGNAKVEQRVEKIWARVHLTMYAMDGVWVRMTEAVDEEAP